MVGWASTVREKEKNMGKKKHEKKHEKKNCVYILARWNATRVKTRRKILT
jgi:hypothetical protein